MAVDMRGHGESAWDAEARYVVQDYVRDMEGFVEQLGLRNMSSGAIRPEAAWRRSTPDCTPIA
jgi:pimeloyl-ACP methyl ester carboxylesterase